MAEIAALKLIVPSDVTHTGGSASVSATGKVTFSDTQYLDVEGIFSSTHDNYLIVMQGTGDNGRDISYQYITNGSIEAAVGAYTRQRLRSESNSVTGLRDTLDMARLSTSSSSNSGYHLYIYAPAIAQPTASRSVTACAYSGAFIDDYAVTYSQSTAHTGIRFRANPNTYNITGSLTVYGLSQ